MVPPQHKPRLRASLRVWFGEAWDMHPHQVPHDQCCDSEDVYTCMGGGCRPVSWVEDDECDTDLACYCEEETTDCGTLSIPTRCAWCQHPCSCIKWLVAWLACCVGPEPIPLLPDSSTRIPKCGEPPVLLPGESCFPVSDVSLPPLPLPFADLFVHRWHCLP